MPGVIYIWYPSWFRSLLVFLLHHIVVCVLACIVFHFSQCSRCAGTACHSFEHTMQVLFHDDHVDIVGCVLDPAAQNRVCRLKHAVQEGLPSRFGVYTDGRGKGAHLGIPGPNECQRGGASCRSQLVARSICDLRALWQTIGIRTHRPDLHFKMVARVRQHTSLCVVPLFTSVEVISANSGTTVKTAAIEGDAHLINLSGSVMLGCHGESFTLGMGESILISDRRRSDSESLIVTGGQLPGQIVFLRSPQEVLDLTVLT